LATVQVTAITFLKNIRNNAISSISDKLYPGIGKLTVTATCISRNVGTIKHELGFTISGKCVISSTFVTLTPAASKLDAVPPVEIIENLQEQNLCISGTKIATFEKKKAIHGSYCKTSFFFEKNNY